MTHRRAPAASTDAELPLDYSAIEEPPLRAAYETLDLRLHMSFEQAMADRALAIGIRNTAAAIARRRAEAAQPTSTPEAPCED